MTILVAEDDPITRSGITESIEGEGFRVIATANGREALDAFRSEKPDLVCLDIMMPEVDGFEVCRQIREANAAIPILFLSAKNEEIDVVVGLELGADDFIRKPFGKRELIARIRSSLRRQALSQTDRQGQPFSMLDLEVFPKELRAVREGQGIDLIPREVSILKLLWEREGEVVARDELLNVCWGSEYFPESRTLDQHISKLRKRVEVDPKNPELIETVRGVGYRFRV